MKKSIIAVVVFLLLVALLPIIGNRFMKQTINNRITELKTVGLEIKKDATDSSYLATSRHIEFILKNPQKFIAYLNISAHKQSPAYINAMLHGVVLGVDIKYSNLPFVKALEVEISPLTLSDGIRDKKKKKDKDFLRYLQKFLQSKGIVYHINYNIIDKKFNGYMKDIQQKYTFKDGTKIDIELSKANFNGEGIVVAPKMMDTKIKVFHLNIVQKAETFAMAVEKFSSSMHFDAKSSYLSSARVDKINMRVSGSRNDTDIDVKKLNFHASAIAKGKNTQLNARASFEQVNIISNNLNIMLKKFGFNMLANEMDKESYMKLIQLLVEAKKGYTPQINREIHERVVTLFSKGFVVKIEKLGVENIILNGKTELHGFDFKSKFKFLADKDLVQKIKLSPLMAAPDLEVNATLQVAVALYEYLSTKSPMLERVKEYAKEKNGSYIFEMKVKDTKATVNGKALY